jgi:hypothetical protein
VLAAACVCWCWCGAAQMCNVVRPARDWRAAGELWLSVCYRESRECELTCVGFGPGVQEGRLVVCGFHRRRVPSASVEGSRVPRVNRVRGCEELDHHRHAPADTYCLFPLLRHAARRVNSWCSLFIALEMRVLLWPHATRPSQGPALRPAP